MPSPPRARAAARPAHDPYRLLFERNPNALFVINAESLQCLAGNEAALKQYGYTLEEFRRLRATDLKPPEDRPRFIAEAEAFRRRADPGVSDRGIRLHRRKDGSAFPVRVVSSRVSFDGVDAFLTMAQDVTQQVEAEKALREKDRQLQVAQKMDAVGRLAGGVAHEFNNILTGIMGLAALIQQQLKPEDPASADASAIINASKRAAGLVLRLLTFSRQSEPDKRLLDLNELVARNRSMAAAVLGERVRLETQLSPVPLPVNADPDQLDQVLLNLCLNARDAIRGDGRVRLATRLAQLDEPLSLQQGLLLPGRYATLTVEDSGHGIAPEHRGRLFEPFFTTRGPGQASGLGLSMAYAIARDHDGLLAFDSEVGGGTVFQLYLRLADGAVPAAAPASPSPRPPAVREGSRGTVLVADDEEIVRSAVARVLAPHGFKLLLASDGEEALRLFSADPGGIKLLVLDVVMPKVDGVEAYEKMRVLRPDVPALFMSGYATARARDVIRRRGAAFLPKPFLPRDLLARIDQVLEKVG